MNPQEEIWTPIPGYDGRYLINGSGDVVSINYRGTKSQRQMSPCKNGRGYYLIFIGGKTRYVHTLMAITYLGYTPDKTMRIVVDHINGDRLDNRKENLQLLSHRQNISKKTTPHSSKYVGVSYYKNNGLWAATISHKYNKKHLGYFKTEHDAHLAYQLELSNINKTQ